MSLVSLIIDKMQTAGKFANLTGSQKKLFVIGRILDEIELSPEIEGFISELIDMIIKVDKNQLVINPIVTKSFGRCCF